VAITCPFERFGQRERPVAVAARDGEQARFGTALRMSVERAAVGDDQALGHDRLDTDVVGARGDGAFDLGLEQIVEHAKQRVLQVDGEREQPIEEGCDRRQVLTQAAVIIGQPQAGRVLERLQRAAVDLPHIEQEIELAERRPRIDGFEIVVGPEQALAAGLPLALGDGAKRVESPRNR